MARKATPRAWQRMLSGRRLDLLDPSPLDVEIEDIAHGLARVARWNGQTHGPHIFSVAQHSILVERIFARLDEAVPARWRLMALLHDGPEYVIGDIISPFKAAVGDAYKSVEERILTAIHLRFALPATTPRACAKQIKTADRAAAYLEAIHLAGFSRDEGDEIFGRPDVSLRNLESLLAPMSSQEAEARFIEAFRELEAEMTGVQD
jgi:5'-deoxynucleotidase YfbR-like HD superfamily hydrolase